MREPYASNPSLCFKLLSLFRNLTARIILICGRVEILAPCRAPAIAQREDLQSFEFGRDGFGINGVRVDQNKGALQSCDLDVEKIGGVFSGVCTRRPYSTQKSARAPTHHAQAPEPAQQGGVLRGLDGPAVAEDPRGQVERYRAAATPRPSGFS
jgi:hypothetical protein